MKWNRAPWVSRRLQIIMNRARVCSNTYTKIPSRAAKAVRARAESKSRFHPILERELCTELQLARCCRSAGDQASGRIRHSVAAGVHSGEERGARKAKICMVGEVEDVQPQLQIGALGNPRAFGYAEVNVPNAGRAQSISSQVSENPGRLQHERRRIKSVHGPRGFSNAGWIGVCADDVRPFSVLRSAALADVCLIDSIDNAVRSARVHGRNGRHLPAFFESIPGEGQLEHQIAGPIVSQVKIARPVVNITMCVRKIARLQPGGLPVRPDGIVSRVIRTIVEAF